jgi:uncharacterized membrane protein
MENHSIAISVIDFLRKNEDKVRPALYSIHIFSLAFFATINLSRLLNLQWISVLLFLSDIGIAVAFLAVIRERYPYPPGVSGNPSPWRNTYVNHLPSTILVFAIPMFLFYPEHPAVRGYAGYLVLLSYVGGMLCVRWVALMPDRTFQVVCSKIENNETLLVGFLVLIYISSLFTIARLKYVHFGGFTTDDACFYKFFLNISQGLFNGEVYGGTPMLGWHIDFLIYPFALLFSLWPSYDTFLFIKVGILGVSGIPLYLIIRDDHNKLCAMLVVASYLSFYQIAGASIWDFHEVVLAPFFLLFTFYFFKYRRFTLFIVCMILSLMIKENISIIIFIFFLLGLMEKRDWKWVIPPLITSCLWLLLCMKILLPYFGADYHIHGNVSRRLLGYVKQPLTVLNVIIKPRIVAQVYTFFQSFLYVLPFFAREVIFVIPWFLVGLVMGGNEQIRTWHYLTIIGFAFIALSSSLAKIARIMRNERVTLYIATAILFLNLSSSFYWFRVDEILPSPYVDAQRMAIAMIPKKATVCAPESMLVYLQDRRKVYNEVSMGQGITGDVDFIIFDSHISKYYLEWKDRDVTPRFIRELRKLAPLRKHYLDYEFHWEKDGIFVYKNVGFESSV